MDKDVSSHAFHQIEFFIIAFEADFIPISYRIIGENIYL